MEIVFSLVCGAAVCVFGMWAFLKGQESMAEIQNGRKPTNLKSPAAALRENLAELRDTKSRNDYAKQLRSLLGGDERNG